MNHSFTNISVFFLVSALISFFVAAFGWQRRKVKGAKELTYMLVGSGFWALANTMESGSLFLEGKIFWSKIEYIASVFVPMFFLFFAARFSGFDKFVRRRYLLFFMIIPLITIVLAFTNEHHNLIWTGFSAFDEKTNLIEYYHGLWFWLGYVGYNYLIYIAATYFIFVFIIKHSKTFRFQGWIVFLAGLCPWSASVLYVTGTNPWPGLNITPASISLSGFLFLFAILYVRFLDLIPVAREILVETLSDGILVLDRQNRVQDINLMAAGILGINKRESLGLSLEDLNIEMEQLKQNILDEANHDHYELDIQSDRRTFQIIKQIVKEHSGSRLVIIRDISELVKQEKSIREAEEKYRQLYTTFRLMSDTMPDMIWAKNLNLEYIFVNKSICDNMLGAIDSNEPLGKTDVFFEQREKSKYPDNPYYHTFGQLCIDSDRTTLNNMKQMQFEESGFVKGKFIYLDVHKAPLFNSDGELIGIIGSARNITDRKAVEAELANQSKLRQILTEISSIYINLPLEKVDAEIKSSLMKLANFFEADRGYVFDYEYQSKTASMTYEWSKQTLISRKSQLQNFLVEEEVAQYLDSGQTLYVDDTRNLPEGYLKKLLNPDNVKSILAIPMMHRDKCVGIVGFDFISKYYVYSEMEQNLLNVFSQMLVNIKLRKAEEETLIEAINKAEEGNRLKTAFINNISHEIRTPLNGILSFGQFMIDPDLTVKDRMEYYKVLEKSSNRLIQTIGDYTDIAMITSGTMEVRPKKFELKQLINDILKEASEQCSEKGLKLSDSFDINMLSLSFISDMELIRKVLFVFINNAVKFTEKGIITIGGRMDENNVIFYVQDTGKGIDESKLNTIFDTFMQEDSSLSRRYEGSGLGLAIAQGVAGILGGRVWVESKRDSGSSFYFSVPSYVDNGVKPLPASLKMLQPDQNQPVVLVAEDDEANFLYIEVILKKMQCTYHHAYNGQEVVELCKKLDRIDLVLMDIKMPVLNGIEATQLIKEFRPELPIIALTAYAQIGDEQQILEAGCDAYFAKPIKPDTLMAVIQSYRNQSEA